MTHETLVCLEDVAPERLTALRHGALSPAESERLRAHIAGCPACQARIAELETALDALRAERDLDPGDRVIAGVRARIAGQPRSARGGRIGGRIIWNMRSGRRSMWAGLAALAPVAALILLFVYVFAGIGRHPASGPTPTAGIATPTSLKPIYPTATPATVVIPPYTKAVPASVAWGQLTSVMSHTFTPNGSEEFIPQVSSSDLSTIGGVLFNFSNSGAGAQVAQLAYYTVATGAITKLSPTWHGYAGPWGGMFSIDSRYIVYGFNTQPGATCGVCNNTIWSLDRATGQTWQINHVLPGDMASFESGDHVAFVGADNRVWVANLATHAVTLTLPNGASPSTTLGFQWPYLIYGEMTSATPAAQSTMILNILDLATGAHIQVNAPIPDNNPNPAIMSVGLQSMWLVGKTLYATVTTQINTVDSKGQPVNAGYDELYRLDNAFVSGGQFAFLARWPASDNPGGEAQPNVRLISLGSGYFWDLAEQRLVATSFTNIQLAEPYLDVQLAGPYLVVTDVQPQANSTQIFHVTAYDTSTFSAGSGG